MYLFRPQLLESLADYSRAKFMKDLVAGVIVAIIALPLSIALALASGVSPEQGLYTAIVAGFLISALGGSKVQIAGPTAAFASIVAGIVARNGMDGLAVATVLAGILLILMGVLRMGSMIKFIPYTITTGFTAGIAVTIVVGQLKDFFGVTFQNSPVETVEKLEEFFACFSTWSVSAVAVGCVALVIQIIWPRFFAKIPASLVAVIVTAAMVKLLRLPVNTIGDLYTISTDLPQFTLPKVNYDIVAAVLPDAFTIAILAAIESLLSCVVADEMTGSHHNSNMELVAQGVGNTASALFGGIPATGAIARTAANIKNGGVSPVAGMVHAGVLVLVLVLLMPYAALIPMPCIAAILFVVAYNMSGWRTIVAIFRNPKSDISVMIVTFALTVIFDLTIAIEIGLLLAIVLFLRRVMENTEIKVYSQQLDVAEGTDLDASHHEELNLLPGVEVYEIDGPFFFGVATKFDEMMRSTPGEKPHVRIVRMRKVPFIDSTAIHNLEILINSSQREGIHVVLSGVKENVRQTLVNAGIDRLIGADHICPHISVAVEMANAIVARRDAAAAALA